jgi:hypothetical protein
MAGIVVGSQLQARSNAEAAFRAALRAAAEEDGVAQQRVS